MQIKATLKFYLLKVIMAIIMKTKPTNSGEIVHAGKRNTSLCTVYGDINFSSATSMEICGGSSKN
jgi:hypothetical protein